MKFKPKVDKYYYGIAIPVALFLLGLTALAFAEPVSLWVVIPIDLCVSYFLVSPLFGYVELRKKTQFIKYGFILEKNIPYEKIRGYKKGRDFFSYSMFSLKNSIDHVDILYNKFDLTCVSVVGNEEFLRQLDARVEEARK